MSLQAIYDGEIQTPGAPTMGVGRWPKGTIYRSTRMTNQNKETSRSVSFPSIPFVNRVFPRLSLYLYAGLRLPVFAVAPMDYGCTNHYATHPCPVHCFAYIDSLTFCTAEWTAQ